MNVVLAALVACSPCGRDFSSRCHRVDVATDLCVDPVPTQIMRDAPSGVLAGTLSGLQDRVVYVEVEQTDCLDVVLRTCPSGSVVIASDGLDGVGANAYDRHGDWVGSLHPPQDVPMGRRQTCTFVWVGHEEDASCVMELRSELLANDATCSPNANGYCDPAECAADVIATME